MKCVRVCFWRRWCEKLLLCARCCFAVPRERLSLLSFISAIHSLKVFDEDGGGTARFVAGGPGRGRKRKYVERQNFIATSICRPPARPRSSSPASHNISRRRTTHETITHTQAGRQPNQAQPTTNRTHARTHTMPIKRHVHKYIRIHIARLPLPPHPLRPPDL